MKNKPKNDLIIRREAYRLWFEFYKIAVNSPLYEIKVILSKTKDKYDSWGDVKDIKFDDWWVSHVHLFSEPNVKLLEDISQRQTNNSLLIEVPLNQSLTRIRDNFNKIIDDYFDKNRSTSRKNKSKFTKDFVLTDNSEPKLETIRHMLNIYRDVYLPNKLIKKSLSIPKLLPLVEQYYANRKRSKDLPISIDKNKTDLSNVHRTLHRWMTKAKLIVVNVANGEFPGKY